MYNTYFGFRESPFSVTPDPRFLYSNPVYEEAFATLRYGIEAKKGFIVITGEVGTGKTTLLRKLMRNLDGTVHSVFVFNTHLSFPELLEVILHDLGLAAPDATKVGMLRELNDYFIKQLKQGHTIAMLIDEAQNLTDEALENLRLLSNLETDQEKLMQIVLMGQPELEVKLDQPGLRQLKQRVALRCRLTPLKAEEVSAYIEFRLRIAGYQGKELFHPDAVQQIAFYSNGIPRLINIICDNALLCAYARSQKIASADIIGEVARDIRVVSEIEKSEVEGASTALMPRAEPETLITQGRKRVRPYRQRRLAKFAVQTFVTVIALIAVASVLNPVTFLPSAGRGFEAAKRNLNQWFVLLSQRQDEPEKAAVEAELGGTEQRVLIGAGSSVYKIAADAYGARSGLGMDLIKEFNPQIKNLNRVSAGQDLLLPPLTRETLLRQQPDGSYHFIVASFRNPAAAHEYGRLLSSKGYRIVITPRRVSDDLLLHRVEIDDLRNPEEADRIWQSGLRNEWVAFARNQSVQNQ
jgi:general secretion pathway protein A